MERKWEAKGKVGGVTSWRMALPMPPGRRRFVYVFELETGEVEAQTRDGFTRNGFASVDEAKAFLERDAAP